jgi:hypothetical protein
MLVGRVKWISGLTTAWRELGPYAAIALQLPGGTLIVVSLWNVSAHPALTVQSMPVILQHRPGLFAHVRRARAIVLALLPTVVLSGSTLLPGLHPLLDSRR